MSIPAPFEPSVRTLRATVTALRAGISAYETTVPVTVNLHFGCSKSKIQSSGNHFIDSFTLCLCTIWCKHRLRGTTRIAKSSPYFFVFYFYFLLGFSFLIICSTILHCCAQIICRPCLLTCFSNWQVHHNIKKKKNLYQNQNNCFPVFGISFSHYLWYTTVIKSIAEDYKQWKHL